MTLESCLENIRAVAERKEEFKMKLFLLRPKEGLEDDDNPWSPGYDTFFGFVVRAESEAEAREIVCKTDCTGSADINGWIEEKYSTCSELNSEGEKGIVMSDYHYC